MRAVAKILGADIEFGNFIESAHANAGQAQAAYRLLAAIDGVPALAPWHAPAGAYGAYSGTGFAPASGAWPGSGWSGGFEPGYDDPQDGGRKYLVSGIVGGAAYIDLLHLELCLPEVRSARDYCTYRNAMFLLAQRARAAAQEGLAGRLVVMANNSDRLGASWGGHLNVCISRDLFDRLFGRMYPELFVWSAFLASSILFSGQGKVGSENGRLWAPYQISQRADFFEQIGGASAVMTTHFRPMVNARDEAHVAQATGLARLHNIFHDTTLCDTAGYLTAGLSQLVLAMLETGWCDTGVMLEDPLHALSAWSRDPDLHATARLVDGRTVTAIDHQRLFLDAARRFAASDDAHVVPEATEIVRLWETTLDQLAARDWGTLARKLDWVLKRTLLSRLADRGLGWDSAPVRAADLLFASVDPADGLFLAVLAAGGVDRLVSSEDVEHAGREPPEDTRAWGRTMLLRGLDRDAIASINWDEIVLRPDRVGALPRRVAFPDPRRHGRADMEQILNLLNPGMAAPVHTDGRSITPRNPKEISA